MKIERLYSDYQEEERLYSTGNDELDELMERAFCEGYEYAQREFAFNTYKGLTEEGVKKLKKERGKIAKRLLKTRKNINNPSAYKLDYRREGSGPGPTGHHILGPEVKGMSRDPFTGKREGSTWFVRGDEKDGGTIKDNIKMLRESSRREALSRSKKAAKDAETYFKTYYHK